MQIETKPSQLLLVSLAEQVVELLKAGDINKLADPFGYALKHDRDAATAIRDDLGWSLRNLGASSLSPTRPCSVPKVEYFKPNAGVMHRIR